MYFIYLLYTAIARSIELRDSACHTRWVQAQGGQEFARWQFPLIALGHLAFYVVMTAEVLHFQPAIHWLWALPYLAAQGLRYWSIHSLGNFWNTRIWIVPGTAPIKRGPYRFMSHPIYLVVAIEFIAPPLFFGATHWTPWVWLPNAVLLALRIHAENQALSRHSREGGNPEVFERTGSPPSRG